MPRILILGGGIGGLSAAHELAHSGHGTNVIVIEKNPTFGGLARSGSIPNSSGYNRRDLPTEICWRIYGYNYRYLRNIMRQISTPEGNVHDRLVDITDFLSTSKDGRELTFNNNKSTINILANEPGMNENKDEVINRILKGFTACQERLDRLDNITWEDFITGGNVSSLTPEMYTWMVKSLGPFLGVDIYRVNASSIIKVLESLAANENGKISILDGPTNERFIDPWVEHLKKLGVTFLPETEIVEWTIDNKTMTNITIKRNGKISIFPADYVVCALSMDTVSDLVRRTPKLQSHKMFSVLPTLADRGRQNMIGLQLYFTEEIKVPSTGIYLPDSPWQLVIEPQGKLWRNNISTTYGDGKIKDIWSIGLDDPIVHGEFIKKSWTECSDIEIFAEVWHEIINLSTLGNYKTSSGKTLKELGYERAAIWDERLPKFSTNKGTLELRPPIRTSLDNMYFATAYSKVDQEMYLMDSAAEAGTKAGRAIMEDGNLDPGPHNSVLKPEERKFSFILGPPRAIDFISMKMNLPYFSNINSKSYIILSWVTVFLLILLLILAIRKI